MPLFDVNRIPTRVTRMTAGRNSLTQRIYRSPNKYRHLVSNAWDLTRILKKTKTKIEKET